MTLPNANELDLTGQKTVTLQTPKSINKGQRTELISSSTDDFDRFAQPVSNQVNLGNRQRQEDGQLIQDVGQPQNLVNQRMENLQKMQINNPLNQNRPNSSHNRSPHKTQQRSESRSVQFRARYAQNRTVAWAGYLQWIEKTKPDHAGNGIQNRTRELTCQISVDSADADLKRKVASWPLKLWVRPVPKILFKTDDKTILPYLKDAKQVEIKPSDCRALQSLLGITTDKYVGCIRFEAVEMDGVQMLILVYDPDKQIFDGLVPNDQEGFIDSLKKAIAKAKNSMITPRNSVMKNKV